MKDTSPMFSVVNGKVMRATCTARVEVLPRASAALLNDMLAALLCIDAALNQNATFPADVELARKAARAAIAKAVQP